MSTSKADCLASVFLAQRFRIGRLNFAFLHARHIFQSESGLIHIFWKSWCSWDEKVPIDLVGKPFNIQQDFALLHDSVPRYAYEKVSVTFHELSKKKVLLPWV